MFIKKQLIYINSIKLKSKIKKSVLTNSITRNTEIKPIYEIRLAEEIELSRIKNEQEEF